MSFVLGQKLIEYAIRVGVDDVQKNPDLVRMMFMATKLENEGRDLTPTGQAQKVREPLVMDYFQQRIAQLPKSKGETGLNDLFKNSNQALDDIAQYLQECNMSIRQGYPQEAKDLPCIAITLGNEDENQYLGQLKGRYVDDAKNKAYKAVGSDWATQYNIQIITTNYDEVEIWYHLLKYSFLTYRSAMEAYGLRNQRISFLDMEPAPEYLQAGAFAYQRTCIFNAEKDEVIPVEERGFNSLAFGVVSEGQETPLEGDGQIIPEPEAP